MKDGLQSCQSGGGMEPQRIVASGPGTENDPGGIPLRVSKMSPSRKYYFSVIISMQYAIVDKIG